MPAMNSLIRTLRCNSEFAQHCWTYKRVIRNHPVDVYKVFNLYQLAIFSVGR